jgi:hypothetical protein
MVQPIRTRGLYQTTRRKWIGNWRLTTALTIALILSLASLYTTWDGMVTYIAPDPGKRTFLSLLLALFVAVGIQSIMVLAAWMVGTALVQATEPHRAVASRIRVLVEAGVWTVMFIGTLVASVLFSFHTFYTAITGYFPDTFVTRDTETSNTVADTVARGNRSPHINSLAEIYVRRIVGDNLKDMRDAADAQRQAYFQALTQPRTGISEDARTMLRQMPQLQAAATAWSDYQRRLASVINFVQESGTEIGQQIDRAKAAEEERQREESSRISKQKDLRDQAQSKAKQLDEQIGSIDAEIKEQKDNIGKWKTQLEELEGRANNARFRMQCELGGTECPSGSQAKRGPGPLYHAAEKELQGIEQRKGQIEGLRHGAENKVHQLETDKEKRVSERTSARADAQTYGVGLPNASAGKKENNGASKLWTLPELKAQIAYMKEALDKLDAVDLGELESAAGGSQVDNKDRVADEHKPALRQIQEMCSGLTGYLASERFASAESASIAERARKLSCAQNGLEDAIQRIEQLNGGLRKFDRQGCRVLGRQYSEANTATLIRRADDCLEALTLDGAQADHFKVTFADLRREHNANVHPFVQSLNGLTVYNDKLARLSVVVAAMIDLLVFCIGIIGGKESLRRIDRIGQDLRGEEVLALALAAAEMDRSTDSEHIKLSRLILDRLVPQDYVPDPLNAPHVRYSGYILDSDLQRGVVEDDLVRRQIQMWMSTPKSGVELVLRLPRPDAATKQPDTGIAEPVAEREDEPVRFFFLRELVIDLAEDIVHWDRAHASYTSAAATASAPARPRRANLQRNSAQPPPRVTPFWSWTKTARRGNGGAGATNGSGERGAEAAPEFKIVRPEDSYGQRAPDPRPEEPKSQ